MDLHWVRRRLPRLTKSVLAVFCLAWLQTTLLPCTAAHALSGPERDRSAGEPVSVIDRDATGHHGSAHHAAHQPQPESGSAPCPYCPPVGPTDCDSDERCAYPHDPQIDIRAAAEMALLLPGAAPVLIAEDVPVAAASRGADLPVVVPRQSLTIRYCRFIE